MNKEGIDWERVAQKVCLVLTPIFRVTLTRLLGFLCEHDRAANGYRV